MPPGDHPPRHGQDEGIPLFYPGGCEGAELPGSFLGFRLGGTGGGQPGRLSGDPRREGSPKKAGHPGKSHPSPKIIRRGSSSCRWNGSSNSLTPPTTSSTSTPPFSFKGKEGLVEEVTRRGIINPGGLVIIHLPQEDRWLAEGTSLEAVDRRKYGRLYPAFLPRFRKSPPRRGINHGGGLSPFGTETVPTPRGRRCPETGLLSTGDSSS